VPDRPRVASHPLRSWCASLLVAASAVLALAGGSPENVLLILDPASTESLYIGNYYKHARNVPDVNVLYFQPGNASFSAFAALNRHAVLGSLASRTIGDHIDYILVTPGASFYMAASGGVSDSCYPVSRFSASAAYTMIHIADEVLAGGLTSQNRNRYYESTDEARAFDSNTFWRFGAPSADPQARRYFIGAMLGYSGALGNTLPEIIALIDRSVAVDGTRPAGTFYYMQTTDNARSGPRHAAYPAAVASIEALGGQAEHLMAVLPIGRYDCLGIMTGWASPGIDSADLTIVPGAFCDHLTSYAATFDTGSQEKVSRWIARGASGSWGATEEPCNYAGKFPHARLHVFYHQGLSLGEAAFRSVNYVPFQMLLYGDPMTRPFAHLPDVQVADAPTETVAGTFTLTPTATTTHPAAAIAGFDLLIDGVLYASVPPGQQFTVNTALLPDGCHDLRVLAYDDSLVKSTGRWTGSFVSSNRSRDATLGVDTTSGDWSTPFSFTLAASGAGVAEVRITQNGRVLAAAPAANASLVVQGLTLGAGPAVVQAEALFTDGTCTRSAPTTLNVAYAAGTPSGQPPTAFSYTKYVNPEQPFVVELPATIDDSAAPLTYTILTPPTQSTIAAGQTGAQRLMTPIAGATGSDPFTFQVSSSPGASNIATVTLIYAACSGDTNHDGTVDNIDLQDVLDAWATLSHDPSYNPDADFNDDGQIDNLDLQVLLDNWGRLCP
jgi:hypothetical protein